MTKRTIDRYDALGNKLTFRREELDAFLNLSKLFNDKLRSVVSQQDWLSNLEAQLDSQGPLSSDINQLEQQLRAMQVCHVRSHLWNESMIVVLTPCTQGCKIFFRPDAFSGTGVQYCAVMAHVMHKFLIFGEHEHHAKERVEGDSQMIHWYPRKEWKAIYM